MSDRWFSQGEHTVLDQNRLPVAHVYTEQDRPVVAAAPQMLEALERAEQTLLRIERQPVSPALLSEVVETLAQVQEALKEAREQ